MDKVSLNKSVIYILALEQGKYYVGKTTNLERRLLEHKGNSPSNYNGSTWTSRYKFDSLLQTYDCTSDFDEDNCTKKMMLDHGIDNVRGGTYVTMELDESTRKHLLKEMNTLKNTCFKCSGNHFVKDCPLFSVTQDTSKVMKNTKECSRCGRNTHVAAQCYAATHLQGFMLKKQFTKSKRAISKPKRKEEVILDSERKVKSDQIASEKETERKVKSDQIASEKETERKLKLDYVKLTQTTEFMLKKLSINDTMYTRLYCNLTFDDLSYISCVMGIQDIERVEVCHLVNPYNYGKISQNDTFTVITNFRLYRYERSLVKKIELKDLQAIHHEANLINYDNIVCVMKNNSKTHIQICDYVSCNYFVKYLEHKLTVTSKMVIPKKTASTIFSYNTLCVKSTDLMNSKDINSITKLLNLKTDEYIKLVYLMTPTNFGFISYGDTFVCVTTENIVKYEDMTIVESVPLKHITHFVHESNYIRWNNIICFMSDKTQRKIGIYDSRSCEMFCHYLKTHSTYI